MNIKGSVKKLDAKKLFLIFGILGAAFCALRLYQTLTLIDRSTGFFTDKSNVTVALFFILSICLVVAAPLLFYLAPLSKAEGIQIEKNKFHGVTSILFSLSLIFSVLDAYGMIKIKASEPDSRTGLAAGLSGAKIPLALFVTGVLSLIVLFLDGVGFLTGKDFIRKLKISHLFPSLWALSATINYFTITVSYLNNTSLLIAIFGNVFLMIFLYEYGRKVVGIAGDLNSPSFFATGILAAIALLTTTLCTLPEIISSDNAILYCGFEIYRLTAGLFALSAMRAVYKNPAPDYVPPVESEELGMRNE